MYWPLVHVCCLFELAYCVKKKEGVLLLLSCHASNCLHMAAKQQGRDEAFQICLQRKDVLDSCFLSFLLEIVVIFKFKKVN